MWKIDRMITRNPSFPWIPPNGVWVLDIIHLIEVAIPVSSVIIVTHHNIRVARLLSLLNLANQLLFPKCKDIWIATRAINNNPITIWSHTDRQSLLWITSSCMPEIKIAAETTSTLQLQSLSLAIFFISFQRLKYSVGTRADTFTATNACVSIDYPDMTVTQKINLTENLFGTCRDAIPTGNTIVWIDGNKWRCHTLLQFWENHNFLFAKFSKFDFRINVANKVLIGLIYVISKFLGRNTGRLCKKTCKISIVGKPQPICYFLYTIWSMK